MAGPHERLQFLVQLLDRKAKLLGMDAPVKWNHRQPWCPRPRNNAPGPAALKMWTKFRVDPKDFRGRDLSMIPLERIKEVLSYDRYSGEFAWKDMHRRCKSTRRHDYEVSCWFRECQ